MLNSLHMIIFKLPELKSDRDFWDVSLSQWMLRINYMGLITLKKSEIWLFWAACSLSSKHKGLYTGVKVSPIEHMYRVSQKQELPSS